MTMEEFEEFSREEIEKVKTKAGKYAQDAVQEALLKIWENWESRFSQMTKAELREYFKGLQRGKAADLKKSDQKWLGDSLEYLEELDERMPRGLNTNERVRAKVRNGLREFEELDMKRDVAHALEQLTPEERSLIEEHLQLGEDGEDGKVSLRKMEAQGIGTKSTTGRRIKWIKQKLGRSLAAYREKYSRKDQPTRDAIRLMMGVGVPLYKRVNGRMVQFTKGDMHKLLRKNPLPVPLGLFRKAS